MLKQAISSCFEGNDEIAVEVIVVDDGSTDGTRAYLKGIDDTRIRPVFQSNEGAQIARNKGMQHAHGRYMKHLDDDDYLTPGGLQTQVSYLDETGLPCCYGNCYLKFETPQLKKTSTYTAPNYKDLVVASTSGLHRWNLLFLFKSDLARRAYWNPDLETLHIIAYLLEFAKQATECGKVEEPVAVHRIHRERRISSTHPETALSSKMLEFGLYDRFLRSAQPTGEQHKSVIDKMWEVAHMISGIEWKPFADCYQMLKDHAPNYHPSRNSKVLEALDKTWGPKATERVLFPVRRLKHYQNQTQNA